MPSTNTSFERLHLKNVRCFQDAEIAFDERVTVIVGANASGKTTLMEALASLSHGDDEGLAEFPLRRDAAQGEIALYENGAKRAIARWDSGAPSRTRLPADRFVFLYGRYRRVLMGPEEPPRNLTDAQYLDELASHAAKARTTTLTQADNQLLQDLAGYLRGLNFGRASDARLEAVWSQLAAALSKTDASLSAIVMDEGPHHLIPRVVRNGFSLELTELSDGYQAMLVILLDLMLRYPYLFIDKNPLAGRALVGIDEIDLHLHPRWQRTVLGNLTSLFPNTQFIVTTHSPIIVQAAIDQQCTVLRLIEKTGSVTAEPLSPRLLKRLRGAEVGSVLFEDHIFGAESRFSVEFEQIERRVKELEAKIACGRATAAEYQELRGGLDRLETLVVREDERRADGSTMAQMVHIENEFVKALSEELEKNRTKGKRLSSSGGDSANSPKARPSMKRKP